MLDIIGYISANIGLSAAKKLKMLSDFCSQYDYQETIPDPENPGEEIPNPQTKKQFANEQIENYIKETVHAARWKVGRDAVEIEALDLA